MGMVPDLSGYTLGQYELRQKIGEGGMAVVYRGFQAKLGREVAIKVLPSSLAQNPQYEDRFKREAATAATLEHPHIVPIFDYGTENRISFVVMRLLVGGSLSDRLMLREQQKASLPSLAEVVRLLKQIGGALDYAHRRNVIHRDIKPSNIMFDEAANPFVVDFGIAKVLDATSGLTATGQTIGTPAFMAPEQWRAEMPVPATDQYAVGIMIYAILTGRVPFESPTPYGLMHLHLNEVPQPLTTLRNDLPAAVNEVISRAIAKRPEDRYPSISDFGEALQVAANMVDAERTNFFTYDLPKREFPPDAKTYTPTAHVPAAAPPVVPPIAPPPSQTTDASPVPARDSGGPKGWMIGAVVALLIIVLVAGIIVLVDEIETSDSTPEPTAVAAQVDTALPTEPVTEPLDTATNLPTPDIQASVQAGNDQTAAVNGAGAGTDTPSPTASETLTLTPSPTASETLTLTPSPTASRTPTRTPSSTATLTPSTAAESTAVGWPETVEGRTATVNIPDGRLRMYDTPSDDSAVVRRLRSGDVVGVLVQGETWSLVFAQDDIGYVTSGDLQFDTENDRFAELLARPAVVRSTVALNAFAEPSSSSAVRFALENGSEVLQLFARDSYSFIINAENQAGWVLTTRLTFDISTDFAVSVRDADNPWPETIGRKTATADGPNDEVTLYTAPNILSETVATLPNETVVGVLQEASVWSLVFTADAVGYAFNNQLLFDTENDRFDELFARQAVVTTQSELAAYAAPSLASEVRFTLQDGDAVAALVAQGSQSFIVTADNRAGWVFTANLTFEAPTVAEATPAAATAESISIIWPRTLEGRTATADGTSGVIPIYETANIASDIVATVENGTVVGVIEEGSVWSLVFTADAVGYAFNQQLLFDTENDRFDELLTREATVNVNAASALAVYAAPSISADVRYTLENGAVVRVLVAQGIFSFILTEDDRAGWVFSADLSVDETASATPTGITTWPTAFPPRVALTLSLSLIAVYE